MDLSDLLKEADSTSPDNLTSLVNDPAENNEENTTADVVKQMPVDETQLRSFSDYPTLRRDVFDKCLTATKSIFPLKNERYTINLVDAGYEDDTPYDKAVFKDAILNGKSVTKKLKGKLEVVDNATGQVVSKTSNKTLMNVPYFTDHGTFIRNGVDYAIAKQLRLVPNIYTRKTADGFVEAQFNVVPRTGVGFRIYMDPDNAMFYMKFSGRKFPLYPILKAIGVDDKTIQAQWGKEIFETNAAARVPAHTYSWLEQMNDKAKMIIDRDKNLTKTAAEEPNYLREYFSRMQLDGDAVRRTLGQSFTSATPEAMMAATGKILRVAKKEDEEDDRDSLAFQTIHDASDYLSDKIKNDQNNVFKSYLWKLTGKQGSLENMPSGILDKHVNHLFNVSGVSQSLEELSPIDNYDQNHRIVRLGEGALPSIDAAPDSSRAVSTSYAGFVDPIRSPSSMRVGLDNYLATNARKGPDNLLYSKFLNPTTGKTEWINTRQAADLNIGFPEYINSTDKYIPAIVNSKHINYVPKAEVKYFIPSGDDMFSDIADSVPFKSSVKGMRLQMGSKYPAQALPLLNREAPYVQTLRPDGLTYSEYMGKHMGAVKAKDDGVVTNVTPDYMEVQYKDGSTDKLSLYNNYFLARKTQFSQTPTKKIGESFKKDDPIVTSNFTNDKGEAASGKNLTVAYMNYKGYNYEDAVVMSEDAAKKLTAETVYHTKMDKDDTLTFDKRKYSVVYPNKYKKEVLDKFDDDGVIKPGSTVKFGDPLLLAVKEREPGLSTLGRRTITDASETWDHHTDGIVADVSKTPEGYAVYVKTNIPMNDGDKLANAEGGKGVTALIVPNDKMPKDANGNPIDIILSPLSIVSRTNSGQLPEALLGKVAAKTGIPYRLPGFDTNKDLMEFTKQELAKHGLTDTETLFDPETNKKIPDTMVGNLYMYRLQQTAESKGKSRSLAAYDQDEVPTKGGPEGSKHQGIMEWHALLGANALSVIRDDKLIKGQRNSDFWRQLKLGRSPTMPGMPLVYKKFEDLVRGTGVNIDKTATGSHIFAMTDKEAEKLTGDREIKSGATFSVNDLKPIPGGLFDPDATGSLANGDRFSYVTLPEKMPNPVMENALRVILGKTGAQFEDIIAGRVVVDGKRGGDAMEALLKKIDLNAMKEEAIDTIKNGSVSKRDAAIKRLGFINALIKEGKRPEEFMMTRVPVIPPRFRPISRQGGMIMSNDTNYLYKELINSIQDYADSKVLPTDMRNESRLNLYNNYKAVTGFGDPVKQEYIQKNIGGVLQQLIGKSSPKFAFTTRKVLETNMDLTGLGVAIPDPNLSLNQVGLPEPKAWELYSPFIIRNLVMRGVPATVAAKSVEAKDSRAKEALQRVIKERPVLVNRAPTLHRYSIQALWPVLKSGETVSMNPAVVSPLGLDFDGDQQRCLILVKYSKDAILSFVTEKNPGYKEYTMAKEFTDKVPVMQNGDELHLLDLEDFPHGEKLFEKIGANGLIEFYAVPKGVEVVAYNEQTQQLEWKQVSCWSKHLDRKIELVNLESGKQIYTDNDPRAVYGVPQDSFTFGRFTPEEAVKQKVNVPVNRYFSDALQGKRTKINISGMYTDDKVGASRLTFVKENMPLNEKTGYVLGMMCGDGWVSYSNGKLTNQFNICGGTESVLKQFNDFLPEIFEGVVPESYVTKFEPETTDKYEGRYGHSVRQTYSSASGTLFFNHAIGHTAQKKHLPPWFLVACKSFREGLFAGIFDTDGTISINKSSQRKTHQLIATITTTSLRMAYEIKLLAASLDIRSTITSAIYRENKTCWILSFYNSDIRKWNGKWMTSEHKLANLRDMSVPVTDVSPVANRLNKVPFPTSVFNKVKELSYGNTMKDEELRKIFFGMSLKREGKRSSITRAAAEAIVNKLNDKLTDIPDYAAWKDAVLNKDVVWDEVVSFERTENVETGYDLTVPGHETFMDADGVVLSNTLSYSVPVSADAVTDAINKLMPDKTLLSVRNDKLNYAPRQEYVQGLYYASKEPKNKIPITFNTKEEAINAYRQGKIGIDDPVVIRS